MHKIIMANNIVLLYMIALFGIFERTKVVDGLFGETNRIRKSLNDNIKLNNVSDQDQDLYFEQPLDHFDVFNNLTFKQVKRRMLSTIS